MGDGKNSLGAGTVYSLELPLVRYVSGKVTEASPAGILGTLQAYRILTIKDILTIYVILFMSNGFGIGNFFLFRFF
jgi:hypothetical protein